MVGKQLQRSRYRISHLVETKSDMLYRDWYRSAQAVRQQDVGAFGSIHDITEEREGDNGLEEQELSPKSGSGQGSSPPPAAPPRSDSQQKPHQSPAVGAASKELHVHELVALASCFIFPIIGTWLLHAIRSKLSRPSEGLVSNYNLTIFLLASEIRPLSHLLKMVQARTLYLQRVVAAASSSYEDDMVDTARLLDLAKRLEELEAHVAATAAERLPTTTPATDSSSGRNNTQASASSSKEQETLVAQITFDVKRAIQPDLDALNRAVRRYEKRTTVAAFQTESRLQELEARVRDAITLASATAAQRQQSLASILMDWICAALVLPFRGVWALACLPSRVAARGLQYARSILGLSRWRSKPGKGKQAQAQASPSPRSQQKISQAESMRGGGGGGAKKPS